MNVPKLATQAMASLRKYSPELLTLCGVVSMSSAIVFAVRATPKVMRAIDTEATTKNEALTTPEIVRVAAPYYIPTVIATGVGIACIFGASRINMQRNAALAAAYTMSETALKSYTAKTEEVVGKEKADEIRKAADIESMKVHSKPVETEIKNNSVSYTSRILCYDSLTGRYFYSSKDIINRSLNEFNRLMRDECYMTLNDWFDMLGLDHTAIGDDLGWSMERGYVEIAYTSKLDDDANPTLVIGYIEPPKPLHDY